MKKDCFVPLILIVFIGGYLVGSRINEYVGSHRCATQEVVYAQPKTVGATMFAVRRKCVNCEGYITDSTWLHADCCPHCGALPIDYEKESGAWGSWTPVK